MSNALTSCEGKDAEVLAVIPARGGSKGIPRKNLCEIGGKSLVGWTIEAALASRALTRIVFSTEDEEIANVARSYGDIVPFSRPRKLATDAATAIEPAVHAVQWLAKEEGFHPDYVVLLQPTSPLRTAEDIDAVVALAVAESADGVVSIAEMDQHPFWAMRLDESGRMGLMSGTDLKELQQTHPQRQDFPKAYYENGAVYLAATSVLLANRSFYGDRTYGYVMPKSRSYDIDTALDLQLVRLILEGDAT